MSENKMPISVRSVVFKVCGVDVRCHVLNNGHRFIEGEDMGRLFAAMGDDSIELDLDGLKALTRWQAGIDS